MPCVASYGPSPLYRYDSGRFTDAARAVGIDLRGHGVTSAFGDVDNDGRPDLYVANFIAGQPFYRDAFFINAATFVEVLSDAFLKRDATHIDGAAACLMGIAANKSILTGQPVNCDDLVKLPAGTMAL